MKRAKIPPRPWRVGRTVGGRLGIWSKGCRTDEPDVCSVASVPDEDDEATANLIVRVVNAEAACWREAPRAE